MRISFIQRSTQYLPHKRTTTGRERDSKALWQIRVPFAGCDVRQNATHSQNVNKTTALNYYKIGKHESGKCA